MSSYSYPIIGTDEPVLQQRIWRWTPQTAGSYDEVWRGLNLAKMTAKYNGLVYTSNEAELTSSGAIAELKIKWGATGGGAGASSLAVTTDRWECPEPEVTKPVFDRPQFIAALQVLAAYFSVTPDDVFIANAVSAWSKGAASNTQFDDFSDTLKIGSRTINKAGWNDFVSHYPNEAGLLIRDYRKVVCGQTYYYDSQYSLRHTTRAPNYWSRNVSDDNVNTIYSPARFMAEVTDGSLWNFPLPGRLQFKLAASVTALTARLPSRYGYQIGWLKKASGETAIHGGYIEISTAYLLDQWSTDLYNYVS